MDLSVCLYCIQSIILCIGLTGPIPRASLVVTFGRVIPKAASREEQANYF